MDKSNLRERKPKADSPNKRSKLHQELNKKEVPKKSSCLSCCILLMVFLLPILILPVFPYLRVDKSIEAHYIKLPKSPKFEGNLKENNLLQNAIHFAKGSLSGPETILFINDTIYTGLNDGNIARVDKNGKVQNIVRIGDANEEKCSKASTKNKRECGRPLGLRQNANFIYLVDAYLGVYKVDLETSKKHVVLAWNDKRYNENLKFFDDLDIDGDNIFFTVSSRKREYHESAELHFEASPDGRVFQFNEKTQELKLLMDKLVFPNGIQLTPNKDALLVAEHGNARIIKYYLKGPKQGQNEVFINLPGFPDNIRLSNQNTLFVALVVARNPNPLKPSGLDLLGEYPMIRTYLGRFIDIEKLVHALPKYGLAIEIDINSGSILRSWHDPSGEKIPFVTCITQYKNELYLGSFLDDYIGIVNY